MTLAAGDRKLGAGSKTEPAPCPLNRIALVVNEAAGTASSTDVSVLEERVKQALPETEVNVASVAPQDLDAAFDDAFAQEPDVVVVFGGDGTARAAAKRALETQCRSRHCRAAQ